MLMLTSLMRRTLKHSYCRWIDCVATTVKATVLFRLYVLYVRMSEKDLHKLSVTQWLKLELEQNGY